MKILHKSLLTLLLPVAMIWMVAVFANALAERYIRTTVAAHSIARAKSVMNNIDRLVDSELGLWEAVCNSGLFQDTLRASNRTFAGLDDVDAYADHQDDLWTAGADAQEPEVLRRVRTNPLAGELRGLMNLLRDTDDRPMYVEAFVTNRHGAVAATTGRTSDYRQDDEPWWQAAMERGVFVSDYGYDRSTGLFALDLCLRIDDTETGEPIGVLKAVLNAKGLTALLDEGMDEPVDVEPYTKALLTADGTVIHGTGMDGTLQGYTRRSIKDLPLSAQSPSCTIERVDEASGRRFLTTFLRSDGYGEYEGHGWILALEYDTKQLFAPAAKMTGAILATAGVATVLALLAGGLFTGSLQGRIRRLTEATRYISEGDLERPVRASGTDELADLARAFDLMREKLRHADDAMQLRLAALDAARDIIIVTNHNGIVEYVNPAFTEITGYDVESLIGTSAQELFARSNIEEILPTLMEHGTWQGEIVSQRADGTSYPEDITISAITDASGNINHYVTIKRDISDRKRAERSRAERESLRSAIKAMEQVLGVVGHELRTPLAALRAIAECLLSMDEAHSDQSVQFLTSMHDEVVRMSEMVNNMLEAARLSSGAARWKWTTVNIETAVNDTRMIVGHLLQDGRVELTTNVEPAGLTMNGDPDAIRRLITNLVSNAAKNTRQGRIDLRISERQTSEGRMIRFEVEDTGEGIPPHIADKLGEAFALNRGVVGLDYVQGTGLGLSICKGIVAAHGGSITFESSPGEGTTFIVTLPADGAGPAEQQDSFSITREIAA